MSESLFLDPFAEPPSSEDAPGEAAGGPGHEPWSVVVAVPLDAERLADAFLDHLHLWWPAAMRACGPDSHLGFEEGALLEEGADGDCHRWAEVVGAEGASLTLRWSGGPGGSPGATGGGAPVTGRAEVSLAFAAGDDAGAPGERTADGAEAQHASLTVRGSGAPGVREDWSRVLAGFARFTGGTVSPRRP
ncbi:MAG TPA: hypothetical protein VIG75_13760 [Citricoccus sp.]